mmetsp:Transcript_1806/g.3262  ORF Transcript_1806/g.3262 Transcript_1806/m.3262 type:complete len:415 (-) Transcript_1806:252-1496(-)
MKISKFESFTRQVNGWGFKRITQGPDINSYYHELFLQGMPHLIQWMKRATSSGLGKRKCRSDPRDEPDFYEISKRYPIPDYYNENGGKHITLTVPHGSSLKGSGHHQQPPKQNEHNDSGMMARAHDYPLPLKRETCGPEPFVKRYKLSPPDYLPNHNNQHNHHQNRIFSPQRKWNTTSNNNLEQNNNENDHNAIVFSPTCYYSPGSKIGRDLKDLNVLRDITVDDFWRNAPPAREGQIMVPSSKKEHDLYELYDFPAPIVSNEESSASPEGDFVTKHQWQSLYDSLLDNDDPPHLSSNTSSSQQHVHPAKSNQQTTNVSRIGGVPRPRLPPPPRQMNPNYHCPPRLSRTTYSGGIRVNYSSGHMWRGHAYESNKQTYNHERISAIQSNDKKHKRAVPDELYQDGENKDELKAVV